MGIEKRRHPRFPARLRVVVHHGGVALEGWTRDLCLGGAFLEVSAPPPHGAKVVVSIELPALAGPAMVECVVRWSAAGGVGVSFGSLRASETWAINLLAAQVAR